MSVAAKKGNRLVYALAQVSDRERTLLAVLVAVALPLAVVFLAVLPMLEARDAARARAAQAQATLDWVSDQVRILPADIDSAPDPDAPAPAPIGISEIERGLIDAGLRDQVADLSNAAGGGVDLAFDDVEFAALAAWLDGVAPDWGYEIAEFRIEAADPGLVRATFALAPAS